MYSRIWFRSFAILLPLVQPSLAHAEIPASFCDSIPNSFAQYLPHPQKIHNVFSTAKEQPDPPADQLTSDFETSMQAKCVQKATTQSDSNFNTPEMFVMAIRSECTETCQKNFSSTSYADVFASCSEACGNYQKSFLNGQMKTQMAAAKTAISAQEKIKAPNATVTNPLLPIHISASAHATYTVSGTVTAAGTAPKVEAVAAPPVNVQPITIPPAVATINLGTADAVSCGPQPISGVALLVPAADAMVQDQDKWVIKDAFKDIRIHVVKDFNHALTGNSEIPFPTNPDCGIKITQDTPDRPIDIHAEDNTISSKFRYEKYNMSYHKEKVSYQIGSVDNAGDEIVMHLRYDVPVHYPGEEKPDFEFYCKKKNGQDPTVADFDKAVGGEAYFLMNNRPGVKRLMFRSVASDPK